MIDPLVEMVFDYHNTFGNQDNKL